MSARVAGIHVLRTFSKQDVDRHIKPGHGEEKILRYVDNIPRPDYTPLTSSAEGRSHEASWKRDEEAGASEMRCIRLLDGAREIRASAGAAPCGPAATYRRHSGGPGAPPLRHYDRGARSLLKSGRTVREARPGVGGDQTCAGGPHQNVAVERREASAPSQGACRVARRGSGWCVSRRSATPLLRREGREMKASPAPQRIRAAERWLKDRA